MCADDGIRRLSADRRIMWYHRVRTCVDMLYPGQVSSSGDNWPAYCTSTSGTPRMNVLFARRLRLDGHEVV
jgi:hypothetical protein